MYGDLCCLSQGLNGRVIPQWQIPSVVNGFTTVNGQPVYNVTYNNGIVGQLDVNGREISERRDDLWIEEVVDGKVSYSRTAGGDPGPGTVQNSEGVNNQTPTGTATATTAKTKAPETPVNTQTPTTNGTIDFGGSTFFGGSWFQEEIIPGVKNLYLVIGAGVVFMMGRR